MPSLPALSLVFTALSLAAPDLQGTAEVRGAWTTADRKPPKPLPVARVDSRDVTVTATDKGLRVDATFVLSCEGSAHFADRILPRRAQIEVLTVNGKKATTWSDGDSVIFYTKVEKRAVVHVVALLDGDPRKRGVELALMGAPRSSLELKADGAEVADAIFDERTGRWLGGSSQLRLQPARPTQDGHGAALLLARTAVGLTVGDAEIVGRARIVIVPRRGEISSANIQVTGAGADLQVEGPFAKSVTKSGGQLALRLPEPSADPVTVELRWTTPTPTGDEGNVAVPQIRVAGAFRQEVALQVARDGDLDVVPDVSGAKPTPPTRLPSWAVGLIEGASNVAYQGASATGKIDLFRFEPAKGPPVVVDVADHVMALSEEGRMVARSRFEVRNERGAFLRLRVPPGLEIAALSVANADVRPSPMPDGTWLVPLPRSIETVDGLLGFPVVVSLVSTTAAREFERREQREVILPSVDAPVTVQRATLRLPPRYKSKLKVGERGVVARFDRGDEVSFGFADDTKTAQADAIYRDAVDAYNSNDFTRAEGRLRQLEGMQAQSKNLDKLQSNVDLVTGKVGSVQADGDSAAPAPKKSAYRRVRAQARARASGLREEQRSRKAKAKKLRFSGKFKEAEEEYSAALSASQQLNALDDEESVTYDFEADEIEAEMQEVKAEAAAASSMQFTDDGEWGFAEIGDPAAGSLEDLPTATPHVQVPRYGQEVFYQHMLLSEGESRPVYLDAKRRLRSRD